MVTSDHIKKARAQLGESQETFSKRFGVDQSTLHRWESVGIPDRGLTLMTVERVLSEIEAAETSQ